MSTNTVFPAQAAALAAIKNTSQYFPINRIFCVGRNYLAHAAEMGASVDKATQQPFYFLKDAGCYVASGASIAYPPKTAQFHHEIELVVAIGKAGFQVDVTQASSHIFGYACGLDMTRRDLQLQARQAGKPWDVAKNFEHAAVLSAIVPIQESGVVADGKIQLSVNGECRQSADLTSLIWSVDEIIADLSQYYHLQPGDLIYTGTPAGVGAVLPGDQLLGSIAGIGEIRLHIKAS